MAKKVKTVKLDYLVFLIPLVLLFAVGSYYAYDKYHNQKDVKSKVNADEKAIDSELIPIILLQEADSQKVHVSEKDLNETIKVLSLRANMTQEQYQKYVLDTYPTLDEFRLKIENNLRIVKLINKNINWTQLNVTDADVEKFIEDNKAIMPIEQLNDETFRQNFYKTLKKQITERKQQQMINQYVQSVLNKYNK